MITSNQPKMSGSGVPLPTKIMVDSHDIKPTNVKNGAKLKEIDTGKEFIYNEGTSTWDEQPSEGGEGGGGSSTLSGLTDADISNPTDGQTLVYNATAQKWENRIMGLVVRDIEADGHVTLDKTYAEIAAAAPFVVRLEDNNGIAKYEWLYEIGTGPDPYAYMVDFNDMYAANSENDYPEKLA